LTRGPFDLFKKAARLALQMDRFTASIVLCALALDPSAALEAGEEAGQRWLFDTEPFREVTLGHFPAGEVGEGAPFGLAQAERLQALVELVPPDSRRLVQKLPNLFRVDLTHR
jgi:hypothetical protein